MKNTISIQNRSQSRIPSHKKLQALFNILLEDSGIANTEIELLFVNDEQMRPYYRQYFGEDRTTDVIAFPMNEAEHLGSIVVSTETARRQASEHGQSYWDELRFLIIHAYLHLQGHDHAEPDETAVMKAKEQELLDLTRNITNV